MLKALLIDDEDDARGTLHSFLSKFCPQVTVAGEAGGVEEGYKLIRALQPDIVFLDIQMKDGSGFDLLERLNNPGFGLVFTTAFDAYAIKAFKYSAMDYLLKPIDPDELIEAVNRVHKKFDDRTHQIADLLRYHRGETPDRITISSSDGLTLLKLEDIIRLESDSNYTHFFLRDGKKITVPKSLKEYEEILPGERFYRIHQSHIVNLNYIQKYVRDDGGYVVMEDGSQAWVARRRKDEFLELISGKRKFK